MKKESSTSNDVHRFSSPKRTRKKATSHTMLPQTLSISGSTYTGTYLFSCGNNVPIYEIYTVHALNQIIGYAKFNNQSYGNVYYRGECRLHPSLKPSLFRSVKNPDPASARITQLVQRFIDDGFMQNNLKIRENDPSSRIKVEGMLQHYGVPTRFIDVVDNHWVALWMGLNKAEKPKQLNQYYHYTERSIPLVELAKGDSVPDEFLFQYILLIAVPFSDRQSYTGIKSSSDYIKVDLRQALPSIFLRPHAQHGLVLRRKVHPHEQCGADAYDIAPSIIGILKIRIDKVHEWIGNGTLLTQNNLFPPPAFDYGYDILLSREDLFSNTAFSIARYV